MAATSKTNLAKALVPFLEPFHTVEGQVLKAVWETAAYGATEALELEFEFGFLNLAVNQNDDTVDVSIHHDRRPESICVSGLEPWKHLLGKKFGWGWIGVNQQGYMDAVSLSFGAVTPQLCVTAIASRLSLSRVEEITSYKPLHHEPTRKPTPEYV